MTDLNSLDDNHGFEGCEVCLENPDPILASMVRATRYTTSDASDIVIPPSAKDTPIQASLTAAIKALKIYGNSVDVAMEGLEKDRWSFLEAAYVLWRDLKDQPEMIKSLAAEFNVRITGHRRGPFNTVLKILHAASGIGAETIQFASYHGKLLERCHEQFCRQAGLEPDPLATPPYTPGAVLAIMTEYGSVRAALSKLGVKEDEATRLSRVEKEKSRVADWIKTGPKITSSLAKEFYFDPSLTAFTCVLALDKDGVFRLKLVNEAAHSVMFRHTENWEEDAAAVPDPEPRQKPAPSLAPVP